MSQNTIRRCKPQFRAVRSTYLVVVGKRLRDGLLQRPAEHDCNTIRKRQYVEQSKQTPFGSVICNHTGVA
jgi:hypothetical protein